MPLILTLTDQEDQARRETRTLNQGSLSIGRNPDNFPGLDRWILDDPTRQVSKTHCMISAEGGSYVLEDRSTNGIYINGSPTATSNGSRIVLNDGDQLRLGRYSIAVRSGSVAQGPDPFGFDAPAPARIDPFGGTGTGIPDPLGADPLDDVFGGGRAAQPYVPPAARAPQPFRAEDPFDLASEKRQERIDSDDDLFRPRPATETWQGGSQADNIDAPSHAFKAPRAILPPNLDDLDIDALLGDMPPPGVPQGRGAPPPLPPPMPIGPIEKDSLDDLLGDAPFGGGSPPVPAQPTPAAARSTPQPVRSPPPSDNLDDLLGDAPFGGAAPPVPAPSPPPAATPQPAPQPVRTPPPSDGLDDLLGDAPFGVTPPEALPPEPRPVTVPPQALPPAPPPPRPAPVAQPAPVAPAMAGAPDAAVLLAAFLAGAGVADVKLGNRDPEAVLRAAGEVFRVMVEGLRDVLMSRAAIKNELRVEQTVLRARDNNALKFSVTPEEAVAALLVPDKPGYKPPIDAAREAFADIKSHELAVMAGVQTALMGLLKRFDPAALETRLTPGKLDSLMPGARKARFWELFCMTYKDLAREAEDDFQSVFGREFARAYDAQTRKL